MKATIILAALLAVPIVAREQGRAPTSPVPRPAPFRIVEATIPEMQAAMAAKRLTSRELVTQYLVRIAMYEHRLHASYVEHTRDLPQRKPYWRELDDDDPRRAFVRGLAELLAPQWLGLEVIGEESHRSGVLAFEDVGHVGE